MLILSRTVGESLMIGDDISVVVLSVKGTHIRLGIDAPTEIPVHREEIYHRIKSEARLLEKLNPVVLPRQADSLSVNRAYRD